MDLDRALESLPESARINAAHEHCEGMRFVRELTGSGTTEEKHATEFSSFLAGYDHAMEAGYPELIAENETLQSDRIDLAFGQQRIIELEKLATDVSAIVCFHERDCECELCQSHRRFMEACKDTPTTGEQA